MNRNRPQRSTVRRVILASALALTTIASGGLAQAVTLDSVPLAAPTASSDGRAPYEVAPCIGCW